MAAIIQAAAQDWPTRPVTMVVPFAAGGTSDVIARLVAEGQRTELGQAVIVENVGGAGGMTGANRVARAPPDGYQFVLGNVVTHAQNQSLYSKPLYNAATDFAPVVLVTRSRSCWSRATIFRPTIYGVYFYQGQPGDDAVWLGRDGRANHLACVLLNAAIGIDVTHVPYRGGGQAMQDLMGGRIDYQCPSATVAVPQVVGKTVKALAILTKNRSPFLPGLASAHEQGLTTFDIPRWHAVFLPKGTPAPIVQKLHDAIVAALDTPAMQVRLKEIGSVGVPPERRSSQYLGKFVAAEISKWAAPIRASGVHID